MKARTVLRGLPYPGDELLGDAAVCVAVLDGPVDLSHPCFAGADLTRVDTLVEGPVGRGPMALHGTHVASLIFGQPGSSVEGVAPRCRGLILPVFRDSGEGSLSQLDLARAVERAVQEGAHVINISGGQRSPDGEVEQMLQHALRLCEDQGVLVVSAVGNDGCDCLQVPSAVPSVLAVGAADSSGQPIEVNNWGASYRANGVLAPGSGIEGAAPGGGRQALTGSSFATPLVSGVAALLVASQLRQGGPADPPAAGRAILKTSFSSPCSPGDSPRCRQQLAGLLQAARAFEHVTGRRGFASDSHERDSAMDNQHMHAVTGESVEASGPAPEPVGTERSPGPVESATQQTEAAEALATESTAPENSYTAPPPFVPEDEEGGGAVPASAGPDRMSGGSLAAAPASAPSAPRGTVNEGIRPSCGCGGSPASGCRCGTNGAAARRPLIYAIGSIGYDFRTEANRDNFIQLMPNHTVTAPEGEYEQPASPYDPIQMHDYLAKEPWQANYLTWTLMVGSTPVYALEAEPSIAMDWIRPIRKPKPEPDPAQKHTDPHEQLSDQVRHLADTLASPPMSFVHKSFREAIKGQATRVPDPPVEGKPRDTFGRGYSYLISRVSIPGTLTDRTVRLYSGQVVPVVEVQSRGLFTWNEAALVDLVMEQVKGGAEGLEMAIPEEDVRKNVRGLLDKIYYQFHNLGQTSADRALNAAGTNAFLFAESFADGLLSAQHVPGPADRMYSLDTITVSKSPFCRPGADCHEVKVTFFDPVNDRRARVTYQFTVDVSEAYPVSIAPVHHYLES